MKCLNPTVAYICGTKRSKDGVISPDIRFGYKDAIDYYRRVSDNPTMADIMLVNNEIAFPCGRCACCKILKRKDMSVRLSHEASIHDDCCFITLTYDDDHIPMASIGDWTETKKDSNYLSEIEILRGDIFGLPTLLPADVQKFIKRLRRHLEYVPTKKCEKRDHVTRPIRYFCVGEYGSKTYRPHYHIMIFGWKPSDMRFWQDKGDYIVCRSAQIEKLWRYGFSTVGDVNAGVAKYCARYVTKKMDCDHEMTKDERSVCPEFFLQSVRDGGIGSLWLEKYCDNLRTGFVTVRTGKDRISKCAIPRYYYNRLRKIRLPLWLELRYARLEFVMSSKREKSDELDDLIRFVDCEREKYKSSISKDTF